MTYVTCMLTAKNRDQLGNPTLGNRVWAAFTFNVLIMPLYNAFLSWQRPAVSVQLAFFTTRKLQLGFLAELLVDQTPDVAIYLFIMKIAQKYTIKLKKQKIYRKIHVKAMKHINTLE